VAGLKERKKYLPFCVANPCFIFTDVCVDVDIIRSDTFPPFPYRGRTIGLSSLDHLERGVAFLERNGLRNQASLLGFFCVGKCPKVLPTLFRMGKARALSHVSLKYFLSFFFISYSFLAWVLTYLYLKSLFFKGDSLSWVGF